MSTRKSASEILEKRLGPMTFGKFLRVVRTRTDMTQTEMAKALGISKSSLCDIEKGRQFVTAAFAARVAKKAGLSEIRAIELSIKDQLRRLGMDFNVRLEKAS